MYQPMIRVSSPERPINDFRSHVCASSTRSAGVVHACIDSVSRMWTRLTWYMRKPGEIREKHNAKKGGTGGGPTMTVVLSTPLTPSLRPLASTPITLRYDGYPMRGRNSVSNWIFVVLSRSLQRQLPTSYWSEPCSTQWATSVAPFQLTYIFQSPLASDS